MTRKKYLEARSLAYARFVGRTDGQIKAIELFRGRLDDESLLDDLISWLKDSMEILDNELTSITNDYVQTEKPWRDSYGKFFKDY